MEPHPVPRQITTFEFKLIGFMTLKEFGYLIVFAGLATTAYFLTPGELFKYINAALVFGLGIFLAFYKYNERSIDVWIRNLIIKLFSSSQYYYHKNNEPPSFLENIVYDKTIAFLHTDAQKKLTNYLGKVENPSTTTKETTVITKQSDQQSTSSMSTFSQNVPEVTQQSLPITTPPSTQPANTNKPALMGIVKNGKDLPLPNILVYVKNKNGNVTRILKTDTHGVFSTNRPLNDDSIILEPKDSANRFFFDTLNINPGVAQPLVIRSREAL